MRLVVQAVLTAALVAGGIFVYDSMRTHPEEGTVVAPATGRELATFEERLARLEDRGGPTLSGITLEERLSAVEKAVNAKVIAGSTSPTAGEGTKGGTDAPTATGTDAPTRPSESTRYSSPEETSTGSKQFDEQEIARFKSYMDEVNRRQREEQMTNSLRGMLKSLDLRLNDDQEKHVVAETLKFQGKVRDLWRTGMPRDEVARNELSGQVTKLREEWSQTIYAMLPSGDAEKVVTSMGRMGGMGFGEWRGGPPTPPIAVPAAPVPGR